MSFYFAWVDSTDTTFLSSYEREDESVYSFEIRHDEGDFPSLSVDIINPKVGLLSTGRKKWVWLSYDDGSTDVTPLFFGRLVGAPQDLQNEIVRLLFVAKPSDWEAQKIALADTLRDPPFYDPVFLQPDVRDLPDSVLEGRPYHWHIDRVSHDVTISNILAGEDGTVNLAGDYFYDSLRLSLGSSPVRRVHCKATVSWDQTATGTVDLKQPLLDAFTAAGTGEPFLISSYTGGGLANDWPETGDRIGAGWTVGESFLQRVDGTVVEEEITEILLKGAGIGSFPLWRFAPTFKVDYEASRNRTEILEFTLEADVQPLLAEAGLDEVLTIETSSRDADQPIDAGGLIPIRDLKRASYFLTDRGKESVEYLIAFCAAQLQARARAVNIRLETTFDNGLDLSLRKSATVADDRIPGGTATGKIISYVLSADGDSGVLKTEVTIGCAVGTGLTVSGATGTADYVDATYVDPTYQTFTGAVVMPISGIVTYNDYSATAVDDDGINFFDMKPADLLQPTTDGDGLFVINGVTAQYALLAQSLNDIEEAANLLNANYTEVDLTLKPLDTGPFETQFNITVSDVMIPKQIDLEAS